MRYPIKNTNKCQGFAAVELLLAATLFGFISVAIIGAIIYGRQATAGSGRYERAIFLAEEGIEAVRNIKDSGFSNLSDGTYGLSQANSRWILVSNTDVTGIYSRQITISTVDSSRKTIASKVSWTAGSVARSTQLDTRLTNWRATVATPRSWANAVLDGSNNLAGTKNGIKVATQGNYAYLVMEAGNPDFFVLNVSNPAAPAIAASLDIEDSPRNIVVDGNYAYIASKNDAAELEVIDIKDPLAPKKVSSFDAPGKADAYGIKKQGNNIYLSRLDNKGDSEFMILNLANPLSPQRIGSYGVNNDARDLCVIGSNVYLGNNNESSEILVLNISLPASPLLANTIDLPGKDSVLAVRCVGNTLFVGQEGKLTAINVAVPALPVTQGTYSPPGTPSINDIASKDNEALLFLATNNKSGEMIIVNVANAALMSTHKVVDITGNNSHLLGIAYSPTLDIAVGSSQSNSQEFVIFRPN